MMGGSRTRQGGLKKRQCHKGEMTAAMFSLRLRLACIPCRERERHGKQTQPRHVEGGGMVVNEVREGGHGTF